MQVAENKDIKGLENLFWLTFPKFKNIINEIMVLLFLLLYLTGFSQKRSFLPDHESVCKTEEYQQLINVFQKGDSMAIDDALVQLSEKVSLLQNYAKARLIYPEALDISEHNEYKFGTCKSLSNIGNYKSETAKCDKTPQFHNN